MIKKTKLSKSGKTGVTPSAGQPETGTCFHRPPFRVTLLP
jgi:hypothetical protein